MLYVVYVFKCVRNCMHACVRRFVLLAAVITLWQILRYVVRVWVTLVFVACAFIVCAFVVREKPQN